MDYLEEEKMRYEDDDEDLPRSLALGAVSPDDPISAEYHRLLGAGCEIAELLPEHDRESFVKTELIPIWHKMRKRSFFFVESVERFEEEGDHR